MRSFFAKKFQILLVLIALLFGAFFLWQNRKAESSTASTFDKPSQLPDFKNGNMPTAQSQTEANAPVVEKKLPELSLQQLNSSTQEKVKKLLTVLKSKNDNDPALDQEFRKMSAELKKAIADLYEQIPSELRNERGTIAFLIARDVQSTEDLEFLQKIFSESPCLSLADCRSAGHEDPHFSAMNQTSLTYPQLATLYQLDQQFQSRPQLLQNPVFLDHAKALVKQAELFPVPAVQKKAAEIKAKYHFE